MAVSKVAQISKLAKKIRKTNEPWQDAMARARGQVMGKKIKAKSSKNRQTGKSDRKRDEERSARPPGKRKSRSGVTYYERRKNRSDAPGKLTGAVDYARKIQNELVCVQNVEREINIYRDLLKTKNLSLAMRSRARKQLEYHKKALQIHKENIRNLKRLI